jgi:hypothetical protein
MTEEISLKRFIRIVLAVILTLSPSIAAADQIDNNVYEITKEFENDQLVITQTYTQSGQPDKFDIEYAMRDFKDTNENNAFKIRLSVFGFDLRKADLPNLIDNQSVEIQIKTPVKANAPAHLYLNRDGYIPLDVASGKIWYPEFYESGKPLELLISYGDLERLMTFGPGEQPVKYLGWVLKEVGGTLQTSRFLAEGLIPLAYVREASKRIETEVRKIHQVVGKDRIC